MRWGVRLGVFGVGWLTRRSGLLVGGLISGWLFGDRRRRRHESCRVRSGEVIRFKAVQLRLRSRSEEIDVTVSPCTLILHREREGGCLVMKR